MACRALSIPVRATYGAPGPVDDFPTRPLRPGATSRPGALGGRQVRERDFVDGRRNTGRCARNTSASSDTGSSVSRPNSSIRPHARTFGGESGAVMPTCRMPRLAPRGASRADRLAPVGVTNAGAPSIRRAYNVRPAMHHPARATWNPSQQLVDLRRSIAQVPGCKRGRCIFAPVIERKPAGLREFRPPFQGSLALAGAGKEPRNRAPGFRFGRTKLICIACFRARLRPALALDQLQRFAGGPACMPVSNQMRKSRRIRKAPAPRTTRPRVSQRRRLRLSQETSFAARAMNNT